MRARRWISLLLLLALFFLVFSGCAGERQSQKKKSVVVTVFPVYDWVMQVLGAEADDWDVTFLLDNGVDLHSYQPTMRDIARIASCDILICIGGESEEWIEDALQQPKNADLRVINLLELLGDRAINEERVEGMQDAEEAEAADEADEHVWLSLLNAAFFTRCFADCFGEMDPTHAAQYRKNASDYEDALLALDEEYREVLSACTGRTLLFADRFPFRYLTEAYNLRYYAAFSGCSAESEASFSTIVFLAETLKNLELPAVLVLESSDTRLAETVVSTAGVRAGILRLHSLQSVTRTQIENGVSYLSLMRDNLTVLRTALSG